MVLALAEDPIQRLTSNRLARYLEHLVQTVGTVGGWAYFAHLRDAGRVMSPGQDTTDPCLDWLPGLDKSAWRFRPPHAEILPENGPHKLRAASVDSRDARNYQQHPDLSNFTFCL